MLQRFRQRRLVAILAMAAVSNAAGYLGAQAPAPRTSRPTPRLLSSCDVTIESCGGDPVLGGGSSSGGWSATGDPTAPACGTGARVQCRKDSSWKCLSWVPQYAAGSLGPTGGGGSTAMVCSSSITTVTILYWP